MHNTRNKTTLNRSSPIPTLKDKTEPAVPTVYLAVNKLKYEQDKLLEEYKRHKVLSRQISKERVTSANRQRQNEYFDIVKHSAHMDL